MNKLQISAIRKAVFTLVFLIVSLFWFVGCFFMTGNRGGVVVPHLTVKGIPSSVTALSLTVTGPRMNPVVSYFSPVPDKISVEVPAGNDRRFELVAFFSPTSAALVSRGSASADLVAGESENIEIKMILEETKLVIPDTPGMASGETPRLVQIDDMSGAGWTELVGSDVGWADADFRPYDVDFDSQGRIYVANSYGGSIYGRAFRIDDITGANLTTFTDRTVPMISVAVDQYNDYLYYTSGTQLWQVELDGSNDILLTTTGVQTIRGLTAGDNGILYIAGTNALGNSVVFRYDPTVQTVTGSYTTNLFNVRDTFVQALYIYVADLDGAAGFKILRLDANLTLVDGYGDQSGSADSVVGNFYGPKRFIGILPRKLVIIDEGSANDGRPFQGDRLIAIEDLNGSGWQIYGQTGNLPGQFHFYYAC